MLRRAAFGDLPELAIVAVPDTPLDQWLTAVVLGGQGRYARAAAILRPLAGDRDPLIAGLAATALAAHLRQLGGHAAARPWDAYAVRRLAEAQPAGPTGSANAEQPTRPAKSAVPTESAGLAAPAGLAEAAGPTDPVPSAEFAEPTGSAASAGIAAPANGATSTGSTASTASATSTGSATSTDSAAPATSPDSATSAGVVGRAGQHRRLRPSPRLDPDGVDPDGVDRVGALADALLGLAADAIGIGAVADARRLLDAARRVLDGRVEPPWRVTVRVEWVAAEVELAAGQPDLAVPFAERALGRARAAGAVRHSVKSTLVLGAATAAGGTPDGRLLARGLLSEALSVSLTRGMLSLAWPSALLLADLVPERAADHRKIASEALTSIYVAAEPAMRRIAVASPWVPSGLIRTGERTRTGVELTT